MRTIKLRIAACEACGSTKAVEAPGDVGSCPYCSALPEGNAPLNWRHLLLICTGLGALAGLLR